ncbi:MAG: 50S ribosomal protein L13 [Spirochaetaceae bacterium]|nr:MAG: 50S ribosomal protein L13 [Spirochaetaceae bacterium]
MKTIWTKPKDVQEQWFIIDAEGKTLGRVAAKVASIVRGKEKAIFTPHLNFGDKVVIINAEKIHISGKKAQNKMYYQHSGYIGGMKSSNFAKMIVRKPTFPLEQAIKGMLPHGPLGRKCFQNVKIYAGTQHPHVAQKPQELTF